LSLDVDAAPARDGSFVGAADGRDRSRSGSAPTRAAPTVDLPVIEASAEEAAAHDAMLEKIRESGACVWDID